jgi:chorismate dehydratase
LKAPRLGCVQYLNARPLIRNWPGQVEFDHPSTLCQRLAAGDLDVALVSSFEFLRNPIYKIVDDVAIASDGPVYSVFVAHPPKTHPNNIELDPASITGAALLRCLVAERRQKFSTIEAPNDKMSPLASERARLLIGDQAIRFRQKFGRQYRYWDLADEWRSIAQLPFVYALWLIRPEVSDPKPIANRLRALRDENLANLDALIAAEKDLDHEFATTYYRDYLRFHFGEKEKRGLRMFHELCAKHGLLPEREIEFALV